jgi:L-alanine-DL-glutamate epimerase-like enolase superfamily enzyme
VIVRKIEAWQLSRDASFFDAPHTGRSPMPWDVVVLAITADNGVVGHATALGARSGQVTLTYLMDVIAPVVLGRDVTDREAIWQELWTIDRHLAFFPVFLPGPVDVALWDLAARSAGLPLFRYLGACRTELPVYASSLFKGNTEAYVDEARRYVSRGINAYKIHPPGGSPAGDKEVHRRVREAVGPGVTLMSDPVGDYSLGEAIDVGRDLERLGFHWFEEPFRDFELAKYAELCRALDIPVAATETTRGGPWGVAQAIHFGAVDIVRADVSWKAGITGTMKIAHLAEAHGLRCEVHCTTMGLMDIANLHVSCAISNCEFFELLVPEEPFRFPLASPYPISPDGTIHVPELPGLGVELDWQAIDARCVAHRVKEV